MRRDKSPPHAVEGRHGEVLCGKSAWGGQVSLFFLLAIVVSLLSPPGAVFSQQTRETTAKVDRRAQSVAAIMEHLGLDEGSTVADVGAGRGQDTWTFARLVGRKGTVFAEEISQDKVDALKKQAGEKDLPQVRPVLGTDDDPNLPDHSVDLVFIRYVYHHLAKPREMLRGIWKALKPGGYLVVVDRNRGTLRDWVPRESRAKKHFWIAETTVVREAREEGFRFVECAEQFWHDKTPFVLVFQRPKTGAPGSDPDWFEPLPLDKAARLLLPEGKLPERPVFIALGEGRKLMLPILEKISGKPREIVLEEWATRKEEREPLPPGVSFPSVLTEEGDPRLGPEPIDAVYFLDSYHLLFHAEKLLKRLHEKLAPGGRVYILDREAKSPLTRREASHRRKIELGTVKEEMARAGFILLSQGPQPAPDRFLLIFGKSHE